MRLIPPRRGDNEKALGQSLNPQHPTGGLVSTDAPPTPWTEPEQDTNGGRGNPSRGGGSSVDINDPEPGEDDYFLVWDEDLDEAVWTELHRETFTVTLLQDHDGAALVAGQDYKVQITHTNIGSWGKLTKCRIVSDCSSLKLGIAHDPQSTDTVLELLIYLAADIDAGSYGTAGQLQFVVTLEGFFFTAGAGGSATVDAFKFQGLWADFVNVDGDTMTGVLQIRTTAPQLIIGQASNGDAQYQADGFGTTPNIGLVTRHATGTRASPTATLQNAPIMRLWASGYGSGGYNDEVAKIEAYALQNFDGTIGSTYWLIKTAPAGSKAAAEIVRIASAGVGIGVGAANNASAQLQGNSTSQGWLPPRMTTAQKGAISSPATGLVVFDTDLAKLCVYTGATWETITSA